MRKRDESLCGCGAIKHKQAKICRQCFYKNKEPNNYLHLRNLTHRECKTCKKVKAAEDMTKNNSGNIGSKCLVCYKARAAERYQENKPKLDKKKI